MAVGGKDPVWPLPTVTPKFATWSLGGGRPSPCTASTCQRWHAGVDLTGAAGGAVVVAPEDGVVVGVDKGWTEGTRAVFLRTDSELFLVLGGVIAGSHKEFGVQGGQRVAKGQKLGRIVGSYGMLHFEAYRAEPTRTSNSRWWKDDPPPDGLLNPINYVERMVGEAASLVQTRQRLQALADLGYYKGNVTAPWGPLAEDALRRAQAALGIEVDGKWGPETEDSIQAALQKPCMSLEDCPDASASGGEDTPTGKSSDVLTPLRVVGMVVAGTAVLGITAALVWSTRLLTGGRR